MCWRDGQDEVEVFRQVVGRDFTAQVSGILDGEDEQAYDLQTLFSTDDTEVLFTRVMPDAGWAWPFGKLNISGLADQDSPLFRIDASAEQTSPPRVVHLLEETYDTNIPVTTETPPRKKATVLLLDKGNLTSLQVQYRASDSTIYRATIPISDESLADYEFEDSSGDGVPDGATGGNYFIRPRPNGANFVAHIGV